MHPNLTKIKMRREAVANVVQQPADPLPTYSNVSGQATLSIKAFPSPVERSKALTQLIV